MSREQWGHGYWNGVRDALDGNVRSEYPLKELVDDCLAFMWKCNRDKWYDRTLFPMKEFSAFCRFAGISKKDMMRVYNYVLENYDECYGCYISGDPCGPPSDDYFVLSNLDWLIEERENSEGYKETFESKGIPILHV